jgi:2-dehydro-3-deoxyglucarate aldolase|tara:strand:- start:74309 stop:75118 length:810 start_codon:yes stop_codon:yes gene_type:complete
MTDMQARIEQENPFKHWLGQRRLTLGFWNALANPLLAEIVAEYPGFEWMLFDTEHAPNDIQSLIAQLQAIRFSGKPAVGRPVQNHPAQIKRLLDIGFRNLLIPNVQSVEEAQQAVASTRYPPDGFRGVSAYHRNNGYGRVTDYFQFINQSIGVVVQIESAAAVERLEQIGSVDGVDALFVGPGDLAADLGYIGQIKHPEVQAVLNDIGKRAQAHGIALGITSHGIDDVARYAQWGYCFFTVSSDVVLFRQAVGKLSDLAANFRATGNGQ